MMASLFKPATRQQSKLRMVIDGPAGSGKTFTAIRLATALQKKTGGRITVLSTEFGDAEKYLGESPDGVPWDFDIAFPPDFSPATYTKYILGAGAEKYPILVIDSLSHAWAGEGGALELKDKQGGNQFTAWKNITPMHNRMIEAIKRSPCHVIATMRSKTEYILEDDGAGKQKPRKVGMAPVQRPGMEYEFDVYGCMDWSHTMTITKTRCSVIDGLVVIKPGMDVMDPIITWLYEGVETPAGYYTVSEDDLAASERMRMEADELAKKDKAAAARAATRAKQKAIADEARAKLAVPQAAATDTETAERLTQQEAEGTRLMESNQPDAQKAAGFDRVDQFKRLLPASGVTPEKLTLAFSLRNAQRFSQLKVADQDEILAWLGDLAACHVLVKALALSDEKVVELCRKAGVEKIADLNAALAVSLRSTLQKAVDGRQSKN